MKHPQFVKNFAPAIKISCGFIFADFEDTSKNLKFT